MFRRFFATLILSLPLVALAQQTPERAPQAVTPPTNKVPEVLLSVKEAVVADKSTRTLSVWKSENGIPRLVKAYPMDLGKTPGDKSLEGDHKTPEGIYFPQKQLEKEDLEYSEYGIRAFTLDYPNFFDKRAQKTGSGIWIHSIPPEKTLFRGSRGCVVVDIAAIKEITPYVNLQTTGVVIAEQVRYISEKEYQTRAQKFRSWVLDWANAWKNKELDTYVSNYSDEFRYKNMNKKAFRSYKKYLNQKYDFINVEVSDIQALRHKNQMVFRFQQLYQSPKINDTGLKTLYTIVENQTPKILAEHWQRLPMVSVTEDTSVDAEVANRNPASN